MTYSLPKLTLNDPNLTINLGNYPLLRGSSQKNLKLQDQNVYQSDRPDILLRSLHKPQQSMDSSSLLRGNKPYTLLNVEPVQQEPSQVLNIPVINAIPVQSALLPQNNHQLSTPGLPSTARLISRSGLIPISPLSHKRPMLSHLGTRIERGQDDVQHFVEHLRYKDSRMKSRGRVRERKGADEESNSKRAQTILENHLGRQSDMMNRMIRDMEEYRKQEFRRHMALMDQIAMNSARNNHGDHTPRINMSSRSNSQAQLIGLPKNQPKKLSQMSPLRPQKRTSAKEIKKKLKGICWALAFPALMFNSVTTWAEKRCAVELHKLKDDIPKFLEIFLKFASEAVPNEMKRLVEEKNSLVIVTSRPLHEKVLDTRCTMIQEYLVMIIDQLSLQIAKDHLPTSFFTFLAHISEDDAVIPQDFLSGFELSRLEFNMFGNLKNTYEWRSKMILACYLLLKGVTFFLFMRPYTLNPSISEKNFNLKNMFNMSSVLYHTVMDVLEQRLALADPVRFRPQIQATPTNFSVFDNKSKERLLEVPPEYIPGNKNDIISGFYSRDQVSAFLDDRPKLAKEVKDAVSDFLDVVYDITHRVVDKKEHVKQWFGPLRKRK